MAKKTNDQAETEVTGADATVLGDSATVPDGAAGEVVSEVSDGPSSPGSADAGAPSAESNTTVVPGAEQGLSGGEPSSGALDIDWEATLGAGVLGDSDVVVTEVEVPQPVTLASERWHRRYVRIEFIRAALQGLAASRPHNLENIRSGEVRHHLAMAAVELGTATAKLVLEQEE